MLSVAPGVRVETIECLTLLLPPSLRPQLTFQIPTVDFPKHTPRLTVAERAHALLVERDWTAVLPRDADDPRLAGRDGHGRAARGVRHDRRSTAARLGRGRGLLRACRRRRRTSISAPPIAGILRMDLLHEGLRSGDLRRAVLVAARADSDDERVRLADALFDASLRRIASRRRSPMSRAASNAVPGLAVQAISSAVGQRRDRQPERFAKFFTTLHRRACAPFRAPSDDATARSVARHARVCGRFARRSRAIPRRRRSRRCRGKPRGATARARWVKGRSPVARLFDALAAKGATYADAIDGVHAIAGVTATATGRARDRASAIGLTLVRRTLRERATLEPPDRLGALVDGLMRIWSSSTRRALEPCRRDDG